MENNIENKESTKTNLEEKYLNSETERFKIENEITTSPKELIINEEQEIKEKEAEEKKDEGEEIEEEENTEKEGHQIKIEKKSLNIQKVKVEEILKETKLEKDENLDLLKFELCFLAKKEYKWEVYRTPKETKEFFNKLFNCFKDNKSAINMGFIDTLSSLNQIEEQNILESIPKIQEELEFILQNEYFNNDEILNEFFNIGISSFNIYNNGDKPFEGWAEKKADPHCLRKTFAVVCKCIECCIFKQYNKRWVVLKGDLITYSNDSKSQREKHQYYFDEQINANRSGKLNILITNKSGLLNLRYKTYFERELWMQEIEQRIKKFKQLIKNNKYKSFTYEKKNNYVHWFVDGRDYFEDLYEKLMDAHNSIFITDWWLSPEIWLKRPILESDYIKSNKIKEDKLSRLMDILEHKAKQGVKVYILIYYECSLALTLNSKHTQDTLVNLHKNIKVTRHPSDKLDLLWSHHEKLVIIDQQVGYVGGLDLCWGRYDFKDHPIYEPPNSEKKYSFPFIDYSNARICDFSNVNDYLKESVSRDHNCRMPWHDIHTRIIGPAVADIARHFVERWNHDNYANRNEKSLNAVKGSAFQGDKLKSGNFSKNGFFGKILESVNKLGNEDKSSKNSKNEDDLSKGNKTIIEEEISNTFDLEDEYKIQNKIKIAPVFSTQNNTLQEIINIKTEEEKLVENNDDIKITNKNKRLLSSKEINVNNDFKLKSNKSINIGSGDNKNNIWTKIVDKIITKFKTSRSITFSTKDSKYEIKKKEWMENLKEIDEDHFLVPRRLESRIMSSEEDKGKNSKVAYTNFIKKIQKKTNLIFNEQFHFDDGLGTIINEKYITKGSPTSTIQVLRSAGEWSLNLRTPENSILQGYYQLIENSKHYIFIENQFFISKSFEDKPYLVENKIALYIRNRILKAVRNKEKFRVWIFIPLLPGFEGEPQTSGTLQIILKYTYAGICRNDGLSIIEVLQEKLEKVGLNWEDYIGFYSLRNHGIVNGIPKTEIIYIHSKLMIVDDLYVICGSANINDRSMKGTRDTEFAVLIKEKRTENSLMNNQKKKSG